MPEQPPKPPGPPGPPAAATSGPPRLERVPAGYQPGPATVRAAAPAPGPARPPPAAAATYGLAARDVGPDAAMAAGLAASGALAEHGALRLLYLGAATQASGRLGIAGPDGRAYALVLKRGTVEHASSSDADEGLGPFLVRKGAVARERLADAEVAARAQPGGELVGALLALRLVNPADVAPLLQEHGASVVARALAVEAGTWTWEPGVAPPASGFPLGSPWAMLCAAVRALDAAAVRRRLGDRETRAAARVGGRVGIEVLRLTPQETRAAGAFDGVRSVAELAQAQPGDAVTLLRLALLLAEAELLSFGAPRAAAPAPPPRAPPPAPTPGPAVRAPPAGAPRPAPAPTPPAAPRLTPTPAPGPRLTPTPAPAKPLQTPVPRAATPVPAVALDRASLAAAAAKLAKADHYEVLGVKRDAPAAQVKAAYFRLAKAYHPDAMPAGSDPEVTALCASLFAKVSEAWAVLGEDAKRAAYLQELESGGTEKVDVLNIFKAEQAFQDGTLLVKARRYDEARARFAEAIALHPAEPEYEMWKAWCEFLVAPDKRPRHAPAAAAIEAALKRNPRCAQGYLFLGQMAKIVGDVALAEKHLKRGLGVAPDHADLARELKYLRK